MRVAPNLGGSAALLILSMTISMTILSCQARRVPRVEPVVEPSSMPTTAGPEITLGGEARPNGLELRYEVVDETNGLASVVAMIRHDAVLLKVAREPRRRFWATPYRGGVWSLEVVAVNHRGRTARQQFELHTAGNVPRVCPTRSVWVP